MKRVEGVFAALESSLSHDVTIIVIVLLVATFFRTHLFGAAPPGLQHDEIFKAYFAFDILDGGWPVYFDANNGNEALFPYLAALSISLFGANYFALRWISLVCGILSIALGYCLIKRLFGRRVAILTAAGLAVSFWHIFDSRVALRAITLLVTATASFHFFWLGLERGKMLWFGLGGIFLGATMYTYHSAVLIPVTLILFILLYQLPFQRRLLLDRWRGMVLVFVIAVIMSVPMGYHLVSSPVASIARVRDLSDHVSLLLAGHPGPLMKDMLNVAGMFGMRGDPEWRYNLAGRPVFDPLNFILFCGGFVICLARIRRPEYAFVFLWLLINLIPSAITRNSPSTLRAIGSLTPIYVMPSLAVDLAWAWAAARFGSLGRRLLIASVVLVFCSSALSSYRGYFEAWAEHGEVREIYRADLAAVARYLDGSEEDQVVCLSASFAADLDQQILDFMLREPHFIKWFDGRQALVFPEPSSTPEVLYVFPATCPLREEAMRRYFAELPVVESVLDPQGEAALVAYRLSQSELAAVRSGLRPQYSLTADLGGRVELIGYELPETVEAGDNLSLVLYWRVPQPIRPDLLYRFFVHLIDARGQMWTQADSLGYPVSSWVQGDLVIQWFDLALPPDMPPLQYQLILGLYDPLTGARLSPTIGGVALPEDVVSSRPFSVKKPSTPPTVEELDIPRPREASFDNRLSLLGCDLSPTRVSPGAVVHVSLYWQALVKAETDYLVSLFLTNEDGDVWGEILRSPVDGEYPTALWEEGQIIRDRFDLLIEPTAPIGKHKLWLRLYDPITQTYLPVEGAEAGWVRLGRIRVVDEDEG